MRRSIMRLAARMSGEPPRQGMLDTSILILRRRIDPAELPDEMAISAITLAGDMIAATAIAEGLPLYTTNPADFTGLDRLARIIPVTRPPVQHERPFS